ncbi:hypothetical protein C5167_042034 [Papaver somniferum]|uniref:uncharacterized protein LOC113330712 isoform X1 n=1 Tax=Papaver somniferum TaxID=3469 RepID=UPI000E704802|nr:uncharacterized protein LOC113330712 isoform X1 [Papaver somniferum]RZC87102.1 hypothetical protein C5167_042034 [Papaver somniferum]
METPTPTRRVTRSQTRAAMKRTSPIAMISSNKNAKTELKQLNENRDRSALTSIKNDSQIKSATNSGNQFSMHSSKKKEQLTESKGTNEKRDRSALINITNGSPIAGIAMVNLKSPSSLCSKKKKITLSTPCSGETLLRGQVKTLLMNKSNMFQLQEDGKKHEFPEFCFDAHPLLKTTSLPTQVTEHYKITQGKVLKMDDASKREERVNDGSKKRLRTRSLLFDFYTEKSSEEEGKKGGALVEEMCKEVSQMRCK